MRQHGFTFIELMVTIALGAVVLGLTLPVAVKFYGQQLLDESAANLNLNLRRARDQSIAGDAASSFGVRNLGTFYTLFQGASYATRTTSEDETFNLDSGIVLSGATEVVFSKQTGTTTATSTFTLTANNSTETVNVSPQGVIEKQ